MRIGVKCYFDPHDLRIGCYWKRISILASLQSRTIRPLTTIYLCPFFCVVVRIDVLGKKGRL